MSSRRPCRPPHASLAAMALPQMSPRLARQSSYQLPLQMSPPRQSPPRDRGNQTKKGWEAIEKPTPVPLSLVMPGPLTPGPLPSAFQPLPADEQPLPAGVVAAEDIRSRRSFCPPSETQVQAVLEPCAVPCPDQMVAVPGVDDDIRPRRSSCPPSHTQAPVIPEPCTDPLIAFPGPHRLASSAELCLSLGQSHEENCTAAWAFLKEEFMAEYMHTEHTLKRLSGRLYPGVTEENFAASVAFQMVMNQVEVMMDRAKSARHVDEAMATEAEPATVVPAPVEVPAAAPMQVVHEATAPSFGHPGMVGGIMNQFQPMPMMSPLWGVQFVPVPMLPGPTMVSCQSLPGLHHGLNNVAASDNVRNAGEWKGNSRRKPRLSCFGLRDRRSVGGTSSSSLEAPCMMMWQQPKTSVERAAPLPKGSQRWDIVNGATGEIVMPELFRRRGKARLRITDPKTQEDIFYWHPEHNSLKSKPLKEIKEDDPESAEQQQEMQLQMTPRKESRDNAGDVWIMDTVLMENNVGGFSCAWDWPMSRQEKKERVLLYKQLDMLVELEELRSEQRH